MKTAIIFSTLFFTLNFNFVMTDARIFSSKKEPPYTVLVLYRATNHWLSLSRKERNEFAERNLYPIIQKFEGKLNVRLFDSEAFHSKTSDFIIVECHDLKDYYFFMEYLRDTELFSIPYIELNDFIIGVEGGFRDFEENELKKD